MSNSSKIMAAKRTAVAVAMVCASFAAPAFAAGDVKGLLDLMLKKGVITQADYDQYMEASKDAMENQEFKERRIDQDVAKANEFVRKNADAGQVMKNGMGFQSADGRNTMQLMGRLHMDYRLYTPKYSGTASVDPTTNVLDIRRARLGVKGQIEKDWKYELQGTYGGDNGMGDTSTTLDIAFIDYAANPALSFRAGKFKMPFSLEQLTSSNNIDFMERSMANQNEGEYVPAKETGVMVFGSPMSGTSYGLALSRGRGNKNQIRDQPDVVGRGTANIAKLMGRDDIVTHLGYGYSVGTISGATASMTQSARDESRGFNNFFVSTTNTIEGANRTRSDFEYAMAYGPFKVQGEFFDIKYETGTAASPVGSSVRINYNEVMWNITGESHNYSNTAGTFGTIKPNAKFTEKGGLGAWQTGIRLTNFDATDFAVATGKANKAMAVTYGLNWYVNDNFRFMLNYVDTKFDSKVGTGATNYVNGERAVMLRSQFNF